MNPTVRPLPPWQNLLYFGLPSAFTFAIVYRLMPAMVDRGVHPMWAFLSLAVPLVLLFVAALAAYRLEGRAWAWAPFRERMRLRPMAKEDWGWALLAAAIYLAGYLGLGFTTDPLGRLLWEPPAALDKIFTDDPKVFAGIHLHGQWWLAVLYLGILFFNIFGEELWWRGIIQPRQEAQHGRWAWLVQGFAWTLFHLFWAPDLLRMLPGALIIAFAVQRRRNTWIGVIAHSCLNVLGLVKVVAGILGPA